MPPSDPEPDDDQGRAPEGGAPDRVPFGWARMYVLVLEFLAYVGGLGYAGWWLEKRIGWEPWGLLTGLLLGTGVGLYRMIRESKRLGF
jgi:F0F1-type ATP synthase assembly protein I